MIVDLLSTPGVCPTTTCAGAWSSLEDPSQSFLVCFKPRYAELSLLPDAHFVLLHESVELEWAYRQVISWRLRDATTADGACGDLCAHQAVLCFATFCCQWPDLSLLRSQDDRGPPKCTRSLLNDDYVLLRLVLIGGPPAVSLLACFRCVMLSSTCCLWPTLFCSLNQQDFVDLSPGDSRRSRLVHRCTRSGAMSLLRQRCRLVDLSHRRLMVAINHVHFPLIV